MVVGSIPVRDSVFFSLSHTRVMLISFYFLISKLYDCTLQQASAQQAAFEEQEKRYLRKVLVEERTRYCFLASCFRPVVVSLVRMFYSLLLVNILSMFSHF